MSRTIQPERGLIDSKEADHTATREQRRENERDHFHGVLHGHPSEMSSQRAQGPPQMSALPFGERSLSDREQPLSGRPALQDVAPAHNLGELQARQNAKLEPRERRGVQDQPGQQPPGQEQVGARSVASIHEAPHKKDRKRSKMSRAFREAVYSSSRSKDRTPAEHNSHSELPDSSPPARLSKTQNSRSIADIRRKPLPSTELARTKSKAIQRQAEKISREMNGNHQEPAYRLQEYHARDDHAWERHLPQSADDKTIKQEVMTLFELIDQHVENYYRDVNAYIPAVVANELSKLPSIDLPRSAATLLKDGQNPLPVIKHCLSHLIVDGMSPKERPLFSLLPGEFTALPRAFKESTIPEDTIPYYYQAFSQFRTLCYYLRANVTEAANYIRQLRETVGRMVQLCSIAFSPWEDPAQNADDRRTMLDGIFNNAAHTGIKLFSHPSLFLFKWTLTKEGRAALEIMTRPWLLKATNEYSEWLEKAEVMVHSSSQPFEPDAKPAPIKQATNLRETDLSLNVTSYGSSPGVRGVYELRGQGSHYMSPRRVQSDSMPLRAPASTSLHEGQPSSGTPRISAVEEIGPNYSVIASVSNTQRPLPVPPKENPPDGKVASTVLQRYEIN